MLKIVSNTTPLISLIKIDKLSLLKDLYGQIIVPQEVFNEMETGKEKGHYADLSKINWVKIKKINDEKSLSYFLDLDKGEAETIILANEIGADLTIIDETLGRIHAKHANLKVTGTLGVLLKAKNFGYIQRVKPLLYELKDKGIWLSDNLIERALKLAKEK